MIQRQNLNLWMWRDNVRIWPAQASEIFKYSGDWCVTSIRGELISSLVACTYSAHGVDDGGRTVRLLSIVDSGLLTHQCPQFVQVDGGAVSCVPLQVVVSHTHLTKVPWMAEKTQRGQIFSITVTGFSKLPVTSKCDTSKYWPII